MTQGSLDIAYMRADCTLQGLHMLAKACIPAEMIDLLGKDAMPHLLIIASIAIPPPVGVGRDSVLSGGLRLHTTELLRSLLCFALSCSAFHAKVPRHAALRGGPISLGFLAISAFSSSSCISTGVDLAGVSRLESQGDMVEHMLEVGSKTSAEHFIWVKRMKQAVQNSTWMQTDTCISIKGTCRVALAHWCQGFLDSTQTFCTPF